MAQKYWETYVKPIRDKLVSLITARKASDSLTIPSEVKAGLHVAVERYPATGIYVLPPAYQRGINSSYDVNGTLTFPILCNLAAFSETEYLETLGDLVGLVADAIEAKPTLDGLAGVINAEVESVSEPEPGISGSQDVPAASQTIRVRVEVSRDLPT